METWTCMYCAGRKFATEDALVKHLATVHADQEKQTSMKPESKEQ